MWLKSLPHSGRVSNEYIQHNILNGNVLESQNHWKILLGSYTDMHEDTEPSYRDDAS